MGGVFFVPVAVVTALVWSGFVVGEVKVLHVRAVRTHTGLCCDWLAGRLADSAP